MQSKIVRSGRDTAEMADLKAGAAFIAELRQTHPALVHGATRPCGCDKCRQRRIRKAVA